MSLVSYKIHAELVVERIGPERGQYGDDPVTNYVAYSNHFQVDGQMTFSCRPSRLEETLKALFKVEDPLMKTTKGLVPNAHTSMLPRSTAVGQTTTSDGKPISRRFLTRDPIYKAPEGSTKDLIVSIGREVLGRDPGAGVDLFGDLLDEVITPRKRENK